MQDMDTIAAISTALGSGAIGIVRMSGPRALDICSSIFEARTGASLGSCPSHTMHLGDIRDPATGRIVDEVLVAVMHAPGTYTREDIVEIDCHGGAVARQKILHLLLDGGARLATPGEFTKRAFLNGRIDLAQAESVAQVISARTEAGLRVAMSQLKGVLSGEINGLRRGLLEVLAAFEAGIDFSDEDVEEVDRASAAGRLAGIDSRLGELIESAFAGAVLTEGVRTVIVGKPNVGKSSLLNALLMRDRAIVTEVPGTTRDTIEEIISVKGIPLRLIDTAGLHSGGDEVERIGISRSREAVRDADLVLCMFDGSAPEDDHDRALLTSLPADRTLFVINKCDLFRGQAPRFNRGLLGGEPVIISALTRQGLPELRERIADRVLGGYMPDREGAIVIHERHRRLLESARESVRRAGQGLRVGLGDELIAEELRGSLAALGEITGQEIVEDLLDVVFRDFCIGK